MVASQLPPLPTPLLTEWSWKSPIWEHKSHDFLSSTFHISKIWYKDSFFKTVLVNNQNIFFKRRKSLHGPPWTSTQYPATPRARVKAKPQINYFWSIVPWYTKRALSIHRLASSCLSVGVNSIQGKRVRRELTYQNKKKEHVVHWDQEQQWQQKALQVRIELWH